MTTPNLWLRIIFREIEMKLIPALIILLFVSVSGADGQESESVYAVGVDGLACPFCSYGVEKQLQKLDGVEQLETDIKLGQVIIQMQAGKTLERDRVEDAIERAGFSLRSFGPVGNKEAP
jgi:mercuric ion binding protein